MQTDSSAAPGEYDQEVIVQFHDGRPEWYLLR